MEPCLTLALLRDLGLDTDRLASLAGAPSDIAGEQCFDLGKLESASVDYQPNTLALNLGVPQVALRREARGYLSPELWDQGINSGFVSYAFNGNRREFDRQKISSYYLGLRNGLNLGPWRLRNESSLVQGDSQATRFTSNQTYAQRDLTAWKGQLTSDDGMLPDSERVYAPTIRGVAESNATVEIRQGGYLLYSSNVPPGPFEINDFYPSGSNGDLQVTVIEADGRQRSFVQAFASLPLMLPKGSFSYSIEAGQYDSNDSRQANPGFASTTLIYGLSERITGFGGVQLADAFEASNLGAGVNTGLGAVSADLTHSVSHQAGTDLGGQSLPPRSTLFPYTTLFRSGRPEPATALCQYPECDPNHLRPGRLSLFQRAVPQLRTACGWARSPGAQPDRSFSFTALEQRFWNLPGKSRQFNATYGGYWRDLSYSLSLDRSRSTDLDGRIATDHQLTLTLSLPLGRPESSTRASLTAVRDNQGDASVMAGLTGRVLDRNAFYSVLAGHDGSGGRTGSASVNATTPVGRFEAGYSHGQDFNSWNLGARGSLVAHAGGVNLGQSLGDTFTLAEVPGVTGARFNSFAGVETGRNGFAVVPYVQPYRANWVSLDTRRLGADIEVENAIAQVVPRRGSATLPGQHWASGAVRAAPGRWQCPAVRGQCPGCAGQGVGSGRPDQPGTGAQRSARGNAAG